MQQENCDEVRNKDDKEKSSENSKKKAARSSIMIKKLD